MLMYAFGLWACYFPHASKFTLRLFQPRCFDGAGASSEWTVDTAELMQWIEYIKSRMSLIDTSPTLASGDHCIYCPAAERCPTFQQSSHAIIDRTGIVNAVDLDSTAVGYELKICRHAAAVLKGRIDVLESLATERLKKGDKVPGYELETPQGNRTWSVPEQQVEDLGKLVGVELVTKKTLTVAQAIKKLEAAGVDEAVTTGYVTRKNLPPRLTEASEKAQFIFGKNTGEK